MSESNIVLGISWKLGDVILLKDYHLAARAEVSVGGGPIESVGVFHNNSTHYIVALLPTSFDHHLNASGWYQWAVRYGDGELEAALAYAAALSKMTYLVLIH